MVHSSSRDKKKSKRIKKFVSFWIDFMIASVPISLIIVWYAINHVQLNSLEVGVFIILALFVNVGAIYLTRKFIVIAGKGREVNPFAKDSIKKKRTYILTPLTWLLGLLILYGINHELGYILVTCLPIYFGADFLHDVRVVFEIKNYESADGTRSD